MEGKKYNLFLLNELKGQKKAKKKKKNEGKKESIKPFLIEFGMKFLFAFTEHQKIFEASSITFCAIF